MGSSEFQGVKQMCFSPDDAVVAWVAPYQHHVEGRRALLDVRTATPPSLASLDQGWLRHSIWDKV